MRRNSHHFQAVTHNMDVREVEEFGCHLVEMAPRISHSDLSVDMNYDDRIDAYDTTEFIAYVQDNLERLKKNLPTRKGKSLPDVQILSKFFIECKERFEGITAMIIFDVLTDYLDIKPEDMYNNIAKPIQSQLRKELAKKVSLDLYKKRVKNEFVTRNGAIQTSFSSRSMTI